MIGYKVMRLSDDGKEFISGANSNLKFEAKCGRISMPGKGIYMSTNKEYVLEYYSGLADNEALITFEFNESEITFGNLEDVENEVAVNNAKIVNIKKLED